MRLWGPAFASEVRRAKRLRSELADELAPRIAELFDALGDPAAVAERLADDLTGRGLEVPLQLALAESVRREADGR